MSVRASWSGVGDGGSGVALAGGGSVDGLAGGAEASLLGSGVVLGSTVGGSGVAVGVGVGVGVDVGSTVAVGLGAAVGSDVGSAMTRTASRPASSVPTTTAWLRTGDCEIDFGRILRSTCRASPSATSAQSGLRSTGQTSLTGVTL